MRLLVVVNISTAEKIQHASFFQHLRVNGCEVMPKQTQHRMACCVQPDDAAICRYYLSGGEETGEIDGWKITRRVRTIRDPFALFGQDEGCERYHFLGYAYSQASLQSLINLHGGRA